MAAKITVISLVWLFAFSVVIFHHAQMQYVGLFQKAARGGIRTLRTHVQRDAIVGDDDPRYMPWPRVAKQDFQSSSARLDPAVKVAPTAGFGAAPTALFAAASSAASSNIGYTVALPAADDSAIRLSASDLPDFPSRFKMAGVIIGALVAAVIPGSVLKSYSYYAAAHPQPPARVAAVLTNTAKAAVPNVEATKLETPTVQQNKTPVKTPMPKKKNDWESAYPQYDEQWHPRLVASTLSAVLPSEAIATIDRPVSYDEIADGGLRNSFSTTDASSAQPSSRQTNTVADIAATKRIEREGKAAPPAPPPVTVDVGNHEDYLTSPGRHIALAAATGILVEPPHTQVQSWEDAYPETVM